MKILIIGAKGMLGQDLAKVLADFDLILWDKSDIDITHDNEVHEKIISLKPDLIINCAAYTAVDDCETNKDIAKAVNGQAVGYLAKAAKQLDIPVVHISTDYVFDGENSAGYEEDFQTFGPLNVYGESKLLGEKLLMATTDKYYLIRTSWLYGANGKNFVDTMIKLGQEKPELKVVSDQIGKPTYTVDLASQIRYIIDSRQPFGIYHVTNETEGAGISWYDFAQKIFELKGIKVSLLPCTTAEFPRPAKRPEYSSLINTKLPKVRLWSDALIEYLQIKYNL